MPDILTPNRGYKEPHPANPLSVDVARLIDQVRQIDIDMANVLAGLAGKADIGALAGYILATARGQANGLAELDGTVKIPEARLPASVLGRMVLMGNWDALTNTPALPAPAAAYAGHTYRVTVAGSTSQSGITDWKVGDQIACGTDGAGGYIWIKTDNTDQVTNVAGLQGNIAASALAGVLGGLVSEASEVLAIGVAVGTASSFTINATTITKAFKRLVLIMNGVSHNSGTAQTFRIELSGNNGSTWTGITTISQAVVAGSSVDNMITIFNAASISAGRPIISTNVDSAGSNFGARPLVSTGYVNAIRISVSGGSNDAGEITLLGYS